jgi:hypothetical protein
VPPRAKRDAVRGDERATAGRRQAVVVQGQRGDPGRGKARVAGRGRRRRRGNGCPGRPAKAGGRRGGIDVADVAGRAAGGCECGCVCVWVSLGVGVGG